MNRAPSIDGSLEEWGGTLSSVEDRVSMGALPTDSALYVAVSIQNPEMIRSVAENGLIVWVDPTGEQRPTYGVKYPLGLKDQRVAPEGTNEGASARSVLDQLTLAELDIIRNDTVRQRIPADFSEGLRADVALNTGSMVYELAIPVEEGSGGEGHGLWTAPTGGVDVGLETPKEEDGLDQLASEEDETPGVTNPGGAPGGRRPGGRAPGGQRGRQPPPAPEVAAGLPTLDLWTTVVSGE